MPETAVTCTSRRAAALRCVALWLALALLSSACAGDADPWRSAPASTEPLPGWEPVPATGPVERARWAHATASSHRPGFFPLHGTSPMDWLPLTWPLLLPHFASDGSILTRWASEARTCPHLTLAWATSGADPFEIQRVLLDWSDETPDVAVIDASHGGDLWEQVGRVEPRAGGEDALRFSPPLACRSLRLRTGRCPVPRGISLRRIRVEAAPDATLPAPVPWVEVRDVDACSATLSWPATDGAFLYRVHRLRAEGEAPSLQNLVHRTIRTGFRDGGLSPDTAYLYRVVPESFSGNRGGARVSGLARTAPAEPPSPFRIRGVVEGFYNQPWSHAGRLEVLRFLGAHGMNFYLYAPKVEGLHRAHWRAPYPESELARFRELVRAAGGHGVTFCYGLSPGMDYRWDDPGEPVRILDKLRVFHDMGVRSFCLLFDDTPDTAASDAAAARRHVELTRRILDAVQSWGHAPVSFLFVPTIYSGTVESLSRENPRYVDYLRGLAAMPAGVQILWVGPGMPFSARISAAQAEGIAGLVGRQVLVWDNAHTTDNFFLYEPFLGPYRNRDPLLGGAVSGILANPMNAPWMSRLPLYTFSRFLADPHAYEPASAFEQAVRLLGGPDGAGPLRLLALQFYGHPILPPTGVESADIQGALPGLWDELAEGPYPGRHARALAEWFASFATLPGSLEASIASRPFREELSGPASKLEAYGRAGNTAMEILERIHESRTDDLPGLAEALTGEIVAAEAIPWRAGQNRLDWVGALVFGSPEVQVDVIGGFLRRVLAMAEAASKEAGSGPGENSPAPAAR